MSRAGPVMFVVLLVASVATAAAVLHARTPDLVLEVTRFANRISPQGDGQPRVAHIRFFVRESDPEAEVEIVGPNLEPIRTLYQGALIADRPVSLTWNGRTTDGGLPNPHHRYRLRVLLPGQDRDMVYPRRIALVGDVRR